MRIYKIAQERYKTEEYKSKRPKGYNVKAIKYKQQGMDWYIAKIYYNGQYISTMPTMFEFKDEAIAGGWGWLEYELSEAGKEANRKR